MLFREKLSEWIGSWVRIKLRYSKEDFIGKVIKVGDDFVLCENQGRFIHRTKLAELDAKRAPALDYDNAYQKCSWETLIPVHRVLNVSRFDIDQEEG